MFRSIMQLINIIKFILILALKLIPATIGVILTPVFAIGFIFSATSYNPDFTMKLIAVTTGIMTVVSPVGGIITSIYLIFRV